MPVYEEVFRRLEGGASYAEVADWLNAAGVPTGPWMRSRRWDGPSLARAVQNPILKGVRRRNERMSQRVNRTGRRKSVKAPPAERLLRPVPHLAFIEPDRYDRVIAALGPGTPPAPAAGRPAPRTRGPGCRRNGPSGRVSMSPARSAAGRITGAATASGGT